VFFAQTSWATRLIGLVLCPVAGGVITVLRHLAPGSQLHEFACGYAFGLVACLTLGAWLHFSAGRDFLGRRGS
jgi:hypothetical protein